MFGDHSDPHKPKVLCRDENDSSLGKSYKGQWWEFQANKAIGALLMPKNLVEAAVEEFMVKSGMMGFKQFDHSKDIQAVQLLTETFEVNAPVARIRLRELFSIEAMRQPML